MNTYAFIKVIPFRIATSISSRTLYFACAFSQCLLLRFLASDCREDLKLLKLFRC